MKYGSIKIFIYFLHLQVAKQKLKLDYMRILFCSSKNIRKVVAITINDIHIFLNVNRKGT